MCALWLKAYWAKKNRFSFYSPCTRSGCWSEMARKICHLESLNVMNLPKYYRNVLLCFRILESACKKFFEQILQTIKSSHLPRSDLQCTLGLWPAPGWRHRQTGRKLDSRRPCGTAGRRRPRLQTSHKLHYGPLLGAALCLITIGASKWRHIYSMFAHMKHFDDQ